MGSTAHPYMEMTLNDVTHTNLCKGHKCWSLVVVCAQRAGRWVGEHRHYTFVIYLSYRYSINLCHNQTYVPKDTSPYNDYVPSPVKLRCSFKITAFNNENSVLKLFHIIYEMVKTTNDIGFSRRPRHY